MYLKSKYFSKLLVAAALCMSGATYSMEIIENKESKESHFSCPTVEFLKTVEHEVTFEDKVKGCFAIMNHIGSTGIKQVKIPINFEKVQESGSDSTELEVFITTVDYANALNRAFYDLIIDKGRKRIEKPSNEEDLTKLLEELAADLKKIVYHNKTDKNQDLFPAIDPITLFTNYVYPTTFVYEGQSYQAHVRPQTLNNVTQFLYIEVSDVSRYQDENQYWDSNPIKCYYKTSSDETIAITTYSPAFSALKYKDSNKEEHTGVNFFNPDTVFVRQVSLER